MTRDDIIRMARETGAPEHYVRESDEIPWSFEFSLTDLEAFAALVAAAEREECARVCEGRIGGAVQTNEWWGGFREAMKQCATAIRARSKT